MYNSGRGNSTDEDRCPGSDHSGLRSIPAQKTPHGHCHVCHDEIVPFSPSLSYSCSFLIIFSESFVLENASALSRVKNHL